MSIEDSAPGRRFARALSRSVGSLPKLTLAAGCLQGICLLLTGVTALLVSSDFCDGSLLCAIRGWRWFLWLALSVALILASPFAVVATALATRTSKARYWLLGLEAFIFVVAATAASLAITSSVATIDVILALVTTLGVIVLLSACRSGGEAGA